MPNSILLYRYLDAASALKTIESRSFKVGRLRDFNDPFEWRMGITGIIPEGKVVANACMEGFIDDVHGWLGIFCFSDTATEPVLWSHYADKHQGVAFEVNYLIEPDKLFKMRYTNERPIVDANRLLNPIGLDAYLLPLLYRLMTQKSPGWSYEREYRAFVDLNKDCEISGGLYFRRIPENFLQRVILGYKCPLEEKYVLKALGKSGFTSTKVVRAKMCLETYSIRTE
ncbi:MAG: DUF2971 domain-containing protein [Verrucomicrobiota bacterium]|jgi:hypothetical protein